MCKPSVKLVLLIMSDIGRVASLDLCGRGYLAAGVRSIAGIILEEVSKRGVLPQKILSFGSDGASVMTGKLNGTAAILRRQNPHMTNIHCIAHRLALCSSQASDNIPQLKEHQQILTDLFYYFKGSSKRETRLRHIQTILDDPLLSIKEIHSVRWLSYFNALTAVHRTLDSLLTFLAEASNDYKDAKAVGLRKKISTSKFLSVTYMMLDAMLPVTQLSQFFQTENIDVALVKVKLDLCLNDLQKVKKLDTPFLTQLKEDLTGASFKGHHITSTSSFSLQILTDKFVDALAENIKKRFPEDGLLFAFSVLGMRPISLLSKEERDNYGNKEISQLADYYGNSQTVTWKDCDNKQCENTSSPLIDSEKCLAEWSFAKDMVVAEKYPRDSIVNLWKLISTYHKAELPNLLLLAQLGLTSAVHTAGCERGFSCQNGILTKDRCRLNIDTQHKLMLVKMARSVNYQRAFELWQKSKERRIYELK